MSLTMGTIRPLLLCWIAALASTASAVAQGPATRASTDSRALQVDRAAPDRNANERALRL